MPSSTTTTTKAGYADRAPAQKSAGLDPSFFFTTVDPPPEGPTIGRTGVAQPQTPETNFIVNMMPPLETDFWRVYANKLRLFGTVEGMLSL